MSPIPEFVVNLRRKIGNDLLWLPGVTAVILRNNQVLLGRRSDNNKWALISGILEPGESPEDGIRREVWEETGIEIEAINLVSVATTDPIVYPNGDIAQYLDLCFFGIYTGGEAKVNDDESTAVGWFDLESLPAPLANNVNQYLEKALKWRDDPARGVHIF